MYSLLYGRRLQISEAVPPIVFFSINFSVASVFHLSGEGNLLLGFLRTKAGSRQSCTIPSKGPALGVRTLHPRLEGGWAWPNQVRRDWKYEGPEEGPQGQDLG